jgi:AbrB family looped-hinge helix DNA binding protein
MGRRGTVVIPAELRRQYGLGEGSHLIAEARPEGILLRPARLLADEAPGWRERLFDAYHAEMAALRQDPDAWAEEIADQQLLDETLADGLEPEDWDPVTRLPRTGRE